MVILVSILLLTNEQVYDYLLTLRYEVRYYCRLGLIGLDFLNPLPTVGEAHLAMEVGFGEGPILSHSVPRVRRYYYLPRL